MTQLTDAMATTAREVERVMDFLLPKADDAEARVFQAMRYSSLGGGKRLRPFIVTQSAKMFAVDERCALRVGAAVEFLHCYSLIHDDLPAMDDSALRRGRPSCHKKFDEATAILAGDGLQALAFEVLAAEETSSDAFVRSELVAGLAKAAGGEGMVGGQMIDILGERKELDISIVTRMHRMKTGALISYAAETAFILREVEPHIRRALEGFAHDLGLAYQITDDLLDATGSAADTGKAVGKDAGQGKATFVTILGVEGAQDRSRHLAAQAKDHLEPFGARADTLREAVDYVVNRRS